MLYLGTHKKKLISDYIMLAIIFPKAIKNLKEIFQTIFFFQKNISLLRIIINRFDSYFDNNF